MFYCLKEFDSKSFSKQQWTIFNDIIWAIVWYTTNVVLIEFLLPQSPKSMRGTVVGLWFSLRISRGYFDLIVYLPFHYMSSDFPMGRGLYFFLTRSILCLATIMSS